MLVIYGGRNDHLFKMTNNVALNDICLFNLNTYTWESLAMFGQMPCSRWGHSMVARSEDHSTTEGFLIFGGVSIQTYLKSQVYSFQLNEQASFKMPAASRTPARLFNKTSDLLLVGAPQQYIGIRHSQLVDEARRRITYLQEICNDPKSPDE